MGRRAAVAGAAVLAASAIAHATGGGEQAGPAVVAVETPGARAATGFVASGRVVTVAHAVVDGPVTVRGADGVARRATVVRRDATLDLAVLAVTDTPAPAIGVGRGSGDRLLLRRDGAAAPVAATVLRRIDARVRTGDGRLLARRPAIELRAQVAPGDSGAPLLGADGRVRGVLFAASDGRPGIAYAVDAAALERLLP
jgi:S1-C subfamily serine protease